MKWWPWKRRARDMIGPFIDPAPDHDTALEEAQRARHASEEAVREARMKLTALHEVTESLRGQRQANRFAERMSESFRRRR